MATQPWLGLHAKSFPSWKDFGALLAHLKFLKRHLHRIEKVAVVADGAIANIMPNIASHFVHAQVRHFDPAREDAAWNWLRESDNTKSGLPKSRNESVSNAADV